MWKVEYDLAYDGGGSRWSKLYRSRRWALIARWWNLNVSSWGGLASMPQYQPSEPVQDGVRDA